MNKIILYVKNMNLRKNFASRGSKLTKLRGRGGMKYAFLNHTEAATALRAASDVGRLAMDGFGFVLY